MKAVDYALSREGLGDLCGGQRRLVNMLDMATDEDAEMAVAYERDVAPYVETSPFSFPRLYRLGTADDQHPWIAGPGSRDFAYDRAAKRWVPR